MAKGISVSEGFGEQMEYPIDIAGVKRSLRLFDGNGNPLPCE